MPKLKTKKSIKKRMKLTKNGKVRRFKAGRRHLMTSKNGNKKRKMRRAAMMDQNQTKVYSQLLAPGR